MRRSEPTSHRVTPARRALLGIVALVGLVGPAALVGCSAAVEPHAAADTTAAAATRPSTPSATALPPLPATPGPLAASITSPPVRVQLPTLGVDSPLEDLGLLADGSLAPPSTFEQAGWYDAGVRPGDPGPAIIAGHVDSTKGPAVFYELRKLATGDPVVVTRADGSVVRFTVAAAAQYPKAQFPTAEVYGPTPTPELRLITCTGIFDRSVRSYEDNLVVTAILSP